MAKDYKSILEQVYQAVEIIKDEKLKEIAFQKLLDDSLKINQDHELTENLITTKKLVNEINGTPERGSKNLSKRKSTNPFSSDSIRDEVKASFVDINPNTPGIRSLKSLNQKWQKYIWVLYIGKKVGLDLMTNGEIAYVLNEKLSINANEKQVNNLTFKVETGFVSKRNLENGTRAWKIMETGIDLIENNEEKTE